MPSGLQFRNILQAGAAAALTIGLAAGAADLRPPPPLPAALTAPGAPTLPRPMPGVQTGNAGKSLNDELECLLEPRLVANVGSPVEGTLSQVLVDRGDSVGKGQIVARLNNSVEAANLELRRAQEEFGKRKVERNADLFKQELISASEKDEMETQTRISGLEVKQQMEVLEQRNIRSPLSGVVVDRFLGPGERVSNEKIMRIAQIDPLNVEVIAPVELFGRIQPGMSADIRLDPMMKGSYSARVVVVDRVIDAASGTFGVRLSLPNPGNRIPAGLKCRARLMLK